MTEKKVHWKTAQKLKEQAEKVEKQEVVKGVEPVIQKNRTVSRPFLVYDKDECLRSQLRTEQEAIDSIKLNGGFYINVNL